MTPAESRSEDGPTFSLRSTCAEASVTPAASRNAPFAVVRLTVPQSQPHAESESAAIAIAAMRAVRRGDARKVDGNTAQGATDTTTRRYRVSGGALSSVSSSTSWIVCPATAYGGTCMVVASDVGAENVTSPG